MPLTILSPEQVALIALRNGFVADSLAVLASVDQAEYLHGLPANGDDRNPERPRTVEPGTNRLSAGRVLDALLRDINKQSAVTGEGSCTETRLH